MDGVIAEVPLSQRGAVASLMTPRLRPEPPPARLPADPPLAAAAEGEQLRLDLLEQALDRSRSLLATVPDDHDDATGLTWLAEADSVIGLPVEFDRSGLLRAREEVAARVAGAVQGQWSTLPEEAMRLTDAAVQALRDEEMSEALEFAVRGLVAFDALPEQLQDRVVEGRMASALGALCCAFFDHERALRFYGIAASVLSPATERTAWTVASRRVADLALVRVRELGPHGGAERTDLLAQAEQIGHRLTAIGEPRHVAAVCGRRVVADVRCEQGAPAAAWQLLELTERAGSSAARCANREAARREAALLRLTRGRCLSQLGRAAEALAELDAALDDFDPELDLVHHMEGVRLRSQVRESAGDTPGALADARHLTELVWARHQRQIGGFMDQVWGRAGAESRRRVLEVREQQLIRTAEQDPLTRLANRRAVERFCATMPPTATICLVMIDIDHFKAINDRFGHAAGDAVLREVAQVLAGSVRTVDQVARWGGEEFLIALPTPSAELGADAATRILARVADHDWSGILGDVRLTLSAGVASGGAVDLAGVLERADAALYRAKREGRNRVVGG